MQIIWTQHAEEALDSITKFIAQDNIDAALQFDLLVAEACEKLITFPKLGKKGRLKSTFELVVHPHYILIYKVNNDFIYIVTLIHTSRNFSPFLFTLP